MVGVWSEWVAKLAIVEKNTEALNDFRLDRVSEAATDEGNFLASLAQIGVQLAIGDRERPQDETGGGAVDNEVVRGARVAVLLVEHHVVFAAHLVPEWHFHLDDASACLADDGDRYDSNGQAHVGVVVAKY